jgi:asparagine synthetase B (glutamine-hydrolysing)
MCGIGGVLSFTNSFSKAYLTRMRDVTSHRGSGGVAELHHYGWAAGFGASARIIDLSETPSSQCPTRTPR